MIKALINTKILTPVRIRQPVEMRSKVLIRNLWFKNLVSLSIP
jgi:hypothetical protein